MRCAKVYVTPRDLDIFEDLYTHSLLNSDQLAAVHCHSDGHRRRLRRRTQKLSEAGYLIELDRPIDQPKPFMLGQKGMNALSIARDFEPKRISIPRSSRLYRNHNLALSDFTLTMDLHVRSLENAHLIDELSLVYRSQRLDVRSHRGWPVRFTYEGTTHEQWVKPDRFLGVLFSDRPANRNARYYAIEQDCGTMPLEANSLRRASINRKLLAYEATYRDATACATFNIPHLYTLFLAPGPRRKNNMVDLAQRCVTNDTARKSILFAVQPPTPPIGVTPDMASFVWTNVLGEEMSLPL